MDSSSSLWVFGYGSLCWHPGFQTASSTIGYVENYVRRFWQGNTTHRGKPGKPGRVATLVHQKEGTTWGVAYEVTGEKALDYLNTREITLGGYKTELGTFYPRDSQRPPFPVLLYIATPSSKDWAGPAPPHQIASQILMSSGPTGHNVEYLLRLAEFMRLKVPDGYDEHLATLETLVRLRIKEKRLCLQTLMGEGSNTGTRGLRDENLPRNNEVNDVPPVVDPVQERTDTFQFSTNLPKTKLRCLNV